ncbi:Gti1/Pac2 family-domain-containing protein [Epithele typhae]|uniref:Gti1/Pac2 family-domain-containing protein n=1 Tax=Epithele typhae TaxID=378194 RepID=UPI002007F743|nr:Gti1/Pac2 family-domain-containing protein [Epithele typhae]KAH9928532.1 Gti1/Pac2 family-domain-containing protein [Epithele typhae]
MFYAPAQDVQLPTHPRLHVRDARDAHMVFEAVRQGRLKPVSRRLNEMERTRYITSGSLFVWEESDDEMGLKRWTDGRVWSQSRMREPYLFYDEKLGDEPPSEPKSKCLYRFVDGPSRTWTSSAQSHYERSDHHPLGLWHLTAYFTYADLPSIPTVDADPLLRAVVVPQGVYRSGKARTRTSDAAPLARARRPQRPRPLYPTSHHRAAPRIPEDQRMIQMLNARPI